MPYALILAGNMHVQKNLVAGANQECLSGFDEAEPFFSFGTDMGYQKVVETQVRYRG